MLAPAWLAPCSDVSIVGRNYPSAGGRLPAAAPLPARDGVGASRVYLPDGPWRTLGDYLPGRFPFIAPEVLAERLARGDIVDAEGVPQRAHSPYRPRTWLWYYREVPNEADVPFNMSVLFRDDRLVVVDKPHFLASTPGGRHLRETALTRLRRDLEAPWLTPLHRLDRETAGVLVFCIDPSARGAYQSLFQSRAVAKEYEALAPARGAVGETLVYEARIEPEPGRLTMRVMEGAPNSLTEVSLVEVLGLDAAASQRADAPASDATSEVLSANGRVSEAVRPAALGRYVLRPLTGRKHQLRVHMRALGCPILNDTLYGEGAAAGAALDAEDYSRPLQLLARRIAFDDPFTGDRRCFESGLRLLE
ncbi:pseudouridine synthase [Pusillimonas sp. TS35]|uniref:pseudouridine synthase n=1 Tax=Paracandidimonas lactea TaxID=2895524 RepID=UPI00136928A7|nr:pseudouridine synthase [Paracandidimonas lactea]MYN13028.1 pseudouridine synthase [Pusillimonas sp. TS35]